MREGVSNLSHDFQIVPRVRPNHAKSIGRFDFGGERRDRAHAIEQVRLFGFRQVRAPKGDHSPRRSQASLSPLELRLSHSPAHPRTFCPTRRPREVPSNILERRCSSSPPAAVRPARVTHVSRAVQIEKLARRGARELALGRHLALVVRHLVFERCSPQAPIPDRRKEYLLK